jgi:cell division protein FtsL
MKSRHKNKDKTIILKVIMYISIPLLCLSVVLTSSLVSESNISLEQLKSKIKTQEGINESLSMQVDELASLDKVEEIATQKGMTYNNNNIKNIKENN